MKHLEFVDKLNESGISISGTQVENKEKRYTVYGFFDNSNIIIEKNYKLKWENFDNRDPFKELISMAIDMDTWKHSWHNEIVPENYDKFREIIQEKILGRAKQIETLLSTYFQIQYKQSNVNKL